MKGKQEVDSIIIIHIMIGNNPLTVMCSHVRAVISELKTLVQDWKVEWA